MLTRLSITILCSLWCAVPHCFPLPEMFHCSSFFPDPYLRSPIFSSMLGSHFSAYMIHEPTGYSGWFCTIFFFFFAKLVLYHLPELPQWSSWNDFSCSHYILSWDFPVWAIESRHICTSWMFWARWDNDLHDFKDSDGISPRRKDFKRSLSGFHLLILLSSLEILLHIKV